MPQRFLRPGITTSLKWNALDWFSQSFYIRLITIVDDFGRNDAEPILLRGLCFPVGDPTTEPVPMKTIVCGCEQMSAQKLVVFYQKEGKNYMQITNWQERPRSEKSKFPPFDNTCEQMFSNVVKCSLPKSSSSPSPSSEVISSKRVRKSLTATPEIEAIYQDYPKKVARPEAIRAIITAVKKHGLETVSTATKNFGQAWSDTPISKRGFCPHPSTWFNQERYMDDPSTWTNESSPSNGHKTKQELEDEASRRRWDERQSREIEALKRRAENL